MGMIDTKKLRASALAASDYNSYSFAKDKPMLCSVEPQTILELLDRLEKLEDVLSEAKKLKCYANEDCMGVNFYKIEDAVKQAEQGDE